MEEQGMLASNVNNFGGSNKPSMTGPKGAVSFVPLNVLGGLASGNIEGLGEKNSLFPEGPVIKCFVIHPNSKIEKNCKKIFA